MNRAIGAAAVLAAAASMTACAAATTPGIDQVRVAAMSCPTTLMTSTQLANPPSSTMVPGTPSGGMVCRYADLSEPRPDTLDRSVALTAAQAGRLAAALDAAKPYPPNSVLNCPDDSGGADLVLFGYPNSTVVEIAVRTSGCRAASDGHLSAPAGAALSQLTLIVGAPATH